MTRIVYLPGSTGQGSFWDPVRHRVHCAQQTCVNYPGLGGNAPDPSVRSFAELQRMAVETLVEPSVLVGQSMGGYLAARIAIEHPELVTHLVLAATSAGIDRTALGLPPWSPTLQPRDSDAVDWVTEPHPSVEAQLAELDVPVLLIWATRDPISPLGLGQRLHELISNSRLVTFESDDHWVARVHAAEVADEINRLLESGESER